jgi:hypothetical protein
MKRIPTTEMQKMFNEGGYWDKTKSGELTTVTLEHRHPSLTPRTNRSAPTVRWFHTATRPTMR